jgi:polyhydroxybutyrate depolymerase
MTRPRVWPGPSSLAVCLAMLAGCGATTGTSGGGTGGAGTGAAGTNGNAGSPGSAGANGSGGVTAGGGGGGGGAGSAGTGGATGSAGAVGSTGCNAATWPAGDQTYTLDVAGTARSYIVGLPTAYASSRPHPLVFAFHGRTGTAQQIAGTGTRGYYGLRSRMTDAIFVAPQGLGTAADAADTGWPNTNGQDIAFVRALIASLNTNYCVDQARIFSMGFSYGGIMSHTIGCQMSDVFRAIAPIAGAIFGRTTSCLTHPVAAWMTHGMADSASIGGVDFSAGETARDRIVALNHCTATTAAVTPSPCVAYDGCDGGYPVHWCPHPGMHVVPDFAAAGIAAFFLQF